MKWTPRCGPAPARWRPSPILTWTSLLSDHMRAVELANMLRAIGARLSVSGEELKVHAPRGALTPEIKRAIQDHRAELLGWLRVTTPAAPTPGPARQSYPLSHNQRQLWFEQQLRREASHYNVPIIMGIGSSATIESVE